MDQIRKKFYEMFWQHEAIRRIFLRSREELLEHQDLGQEDFSKRVFFPRMVLSNTSTEDFEKAPISLQSVAKPSEIVPEVSEHWKGILQQLVDPKFTKAWQKLSADLGKKTKAVAIGFRALNAVNRGKQDDFMLKMLREYGAIGPNIGSMEELFSLIEKEGVKNLKKVLTEQNATLFYQGIDTLRRTYRQIMDQRLRNANRFQVMDRVDEERFADRMFWLSALYEKEILTGGEEEVLFQCGHCPPGSFDGSARMKVAPNNLGNLKCPSCGEPSQYLAPYTISRPIFEDMIGKDGLILSSLVALLEELDWPLETNLVFKPDIELDLVFEKPGSVRTVVETKMFKLENSDRKLISKLVEALHRLADLRDRLSEVRPVFASREFWLVCNVYDPMILEAVRKKFEATGLSEHVQLLSALHFADWIQAKKGNEQPQLNS